MRVGWQQHGVALLGYGAEGGHVLLRHPEAGRLGAALRKQTFLDTGKATLGGLLALSHDHLRACHWTLMTPHARMMQITGHKCGYHSIAYITIDGRTSSFSDWDSTFRPRDVASARWRIASASPAQGTFEMNAEVTQEQLPAKQELLIICFAHFRNKWAALKASLCKRHSDFFTAYQLLC